MVVRRYIWQHPAWPRLSWDSEALLEPLGRTRRTQGRLFAVARQVGIEAEAELLVEEVATTAAIEGERLDRRSIRSSVARRLRLLTAGLPPADRRVDGLVNMLTDATGAFDAPLTGKRLKGWQAGLFPGGYSGMSRIRVGGWRSSRQPMQVVSGPIGRERIHFEAPLAVDVPGEMRRFFEWWRRPPAGLDGLLRAGVAHLWLVTIHPFADGNGRVARAVTDMALAQDERSGQRLYSMSSQILAERDAYYDILERTQRGDAVITAWLRWFLDCLRRSMERSQTEVDRVLAKGRFWQRHADLSLNPRQRKVINRLIDAGPGGFQGGITNRKYISLMRASRETAKRDLADLVARGVLVRRPGGGRSASYELVWPV